MNKKFNAEDVKLLSASEAADLLGVSRSTFKTMVNEYDLPRIKVNRVIKYPQSALLERVEYVATHFEEYLPLEALI